MPSCSCVLSQGFHTVQRAEQAAVASSKPIVTRKFRRKALDPDERYAQERAKMEASRVQRAVQEELRQRRRAARDMLRAREVLLLTPRTIFRCPLESLVCLMSMIWVLKICIALERTTVEAASIACY